LPKMPPFFNVVVSNVVLSRERLYLMGAELEAMYPVSFLFDGYALNVTLVGYADRIAVGFLGCRDAIPSLQRLAVYSREALAELERALALGEGEVGAPVAAAAKPGRPAPVERKAKKKVASKAKVPAKSAGKSRAQPKSAPKRSPVIKGAKARRSS